MKTDFDFDNIGKQMPYQTPNHFFDDIQKKVLNEVKEKPQKTLHLKWIIPIASALVAMWIGVLIAPTFNKSEANQNNDVITSEYTSNSNNDQVDSWIINLSDNELEELVSISENDIFLN